MIDIFSVLLVGSLVTFLMFQNINKITSTIDEKTKDNSPRYAIFASKLIEKIRSLKRDIDSDMECEDPRFCKNDKCDEKAVVRELNDLIRRASFYEQSQSKGKKRKEIEADFVDILQRVEKIIKNSCINGEVEANKLIKEIHYDYKKILG